MYTIRFYDSKKHNICTHSIFADDFPPSLLVIDEYCKFIAHYYSCVYRWSVYDTSGKLLLSARIEK